MKTIKLLGIVLAFGGIAGSLAAAQAPDSRGVQCPNNKICVQKVIKDDDFVSFELSNGWQIEFIGKSGISTVSVIKVKDADYFTVEFTKVSFPFNAKADDYCKEFEPQQKLISEFAFTDAMKGSIYNLNPTNQRCNIASVLIFGSGYRLRLLSDGTMSPS